MVLVGSGIDEKFLGVTLFALVPNTTEFMNAISFALNGNIALRYEVLLVFYRQLVLTILQYGDWFCLRSAGLLASDPGYGCVLRMVCTREDG